MEVRAEITADDHRALGRHLAGAAAVSRRLSFRARVAGWLGLVVVFTWLYTATNLRPGYILAFGLGAAAGLLAAFAGLRARDAAPPAAIPAAGRWAAIALEDEGLRARGEAVELFVRFAAIRAVEETAERVFVFPDGAPAIIVPKRGFASADAAAAFGKALRARAGGGAR